MRRSQTNKLLSLFMAMVMMFSLVIPAAAADASDALVLYEMDGVSTNASPNGSGEMDLLSIGEKDIKTVTVNGTAIWDVDYTKTQSASPNKYANGSDSTLGTYKVYTAVVDGVNVIRLGWSNLKTVLDVKVTTKAHDAYMVIANTSPDYSCTLSGDPAQTIEANGKYTMTFTPKAAQLEVKSIKFQAGEGAVKEVTVPATGTATTTSTVAGQSVKVSRIEIDGKWTGAAKVEIDHVTAKTAITAQIGTATNRFNLNVTTDSRCDSSIDSELVAEGTAKSVTLTPDAGWNIGDVTITAGGKTGTISYKSNSVSVNGQTFSLSRKLDGSAVLSVPAMKADVSISAAANNSSYTVQVSSGLYTDSTLDGVNFVNAGDAFTVTFEPAYDAMVTAITVTTDSGTYKADSDDNYIVVEGIYYRLYTDYDGDITLYITEVTENMEISCSARDTVHDIDVDSDARVDCDMYDAEVEDGQSTTVTFTPDSGYEIRQIRIIYDGVTYRVDPTKNSYVRVDGTRWDVASGLNGVVTLYMNDIEADVDVYATTNRYYTDSDETYRISKSVDSYSNVTYTGTNPFDYGEDTTIRVYSDNKYILSSVKFTMNGKSATIEPFDTSFTLDGEIYYVDWETNADMEVDFETLTGNLTVTAKSKKGTEKTYTGTVVNGYYDVTTNEGYRSDITVVEQFDASRGTYVVANVTTDDNYIVSNIRLSMDGKSVTIKPFTTSFTLDGQTGLVDWTTNANVNIYLGYLTDDLTISSTAVRGTEKTYTGAGVNFPTNDVPTTGYVPNAKSHPAYMAGYGNGYFGPGDNMTRAQAIVILSRLYVGMTDYNYQTYKSYNSYSDAPAWQWYSGYVGYAKAAGLLNTLVSYDGKLQPNKPITRAEFLALLCDFAGQNVQGTSTASRYSDVRSTHWAVQYINYATDKGWVGGYGNGLFGPDENVTRAQICVMVNHITGRIAGGAYSNYKNGFIDVPASHWAYSDIMEATNSHTITGYQNGLEVWAY